MEPILLTKSTTFIIGQVAWVLGVIMDWIFRFLNTITGGHPNAAAAIFLLTLVIYMLMMPLTVRQQKFAKLQNRMMPEVQKIQAKYKGKNDQDSMMRMNAETKEVYARYGVSPTGSCVQLLIQMPILFALYRVIYNIPAYVTLVRQAFDGIVDGFLNVIGIEGSTAILQNFSVYNQFSKQFTNANFAENVGGYAANTFVDVLNRASTADWELLAADSAIVKNGLVETVNAAHARIMDFNNFFGLNIGDSPLFSIRHNGGSVVVVIIAILIPILAAVTQWLNVKLMPQASSSNNGEPSQMEAQMKSMNTVMPIMSAVFCLTLPAGMGIYWVAGALVRSIQQIFINRHIDRMDLDAIIAKNMEKAKLKAKEQQKKDAGKSYTSERKVVEMSQMRTRDVGSGAKGGAGTSGSASTGSTLPAGKKYKQGSLASKADMVSRYNEHK